MTSMLIFLSARIHVILVHIIQIIMDITVSAATANIIVFLVVFCFIIQ